MKPAGLKALLLVLALSSCLLRQRREVPLPGFPERPVLEEETPAAMPRIQIQDYEGRAEGGSIPEWVNRYFSEGEGGVEKMAEYQGKYLFIGKNQGSNPKALGQWQAAFSPPQDFAQLAASRIEARLVRGAGDGYPDNVYGPFFEAMVKKAYDAKYQGVQKEKGFWVRLVPPYVPPAEPGEGEAGAEETAERPVYVFLVLLSVDRPAFETQVGGIVDSARGDLPLPRSQEAAVSRVRENFFDSSF
ncbi:MAG: hypothetical protein LBT87_07360 [Treponema sp.]|jgi:hypothetical protein|nr:hypothetical protein [Treponema sp.]